MASSYNNWPASPDPNAIGINKNFTVCGSKPFGSGGYVGGIKSGDVEKLFKYLINALHTRVEPMMKEGSNVGYGCWGYSYRANVNNPSTLSCHASGTAIDYNAPKHPNGTRTGPNGGGGWSGSQYNTIQQILRECSGAIRWLSGNDPMHFEVYGSTTQVANAVKKLGIIPSPGPGPTPPQPKPEPKPEPIPEEEDHMYLTFQTTSGPSSGGLWIGYPGAFEIIPSMEYYNILVGKGLAKPVMVVNEREFDVIRDSYKRWPGTWGETIEIHRVMDEYHKSESATLADIQTKVS